MSKAEDRSLEAYPKETRDIRGFVTDIGHPQYIRDYYIEGYHQAEKDLKLTLEDVEIIINAFLDFCIENKERGETKRYNDNEWCQEVLKRYKARKE